MRNFFGALVVKLCPDCVYDYLKSHGMCGILDIILKKDSLFVPAFMCNSKCGKT